MEDNQNSGNADRFVTATIPIRNTPGAGGGEQFNMTAKGSQLSMDVRAPGVPGDFRFYYNNDFFGSGTGMSYRLKQLYGQFYNVTAGFTYSIFEDPDVWPDTVDFEGPNSMIFARQATVRYMMPLGRQMAGKLRRATALLASGQSGHCCGRHWCPTFTRRRFQYPLGGRQAGTCAVCDHLQRYRRQQSHARRAKCVWLGT